MTNEQTGVAECLDTIRMNVAAFYEPVGEHLHEVRVGARAFEQTIAALKTSLQASKPAEAQNEEDTIESSATHLRNSIRSADEVVDDAQLRELLTNVQTECQQLGRFSKELDSLSFLMLVTTASGTSSGFSVAHLVSELREMARSLSTAADKIVQTLTKLSTVRHDTSVTLKHALALIDESLISFHRNVESAENSAGNSDDIDAPSRMAEQLSSEIACLMPAIVSCMQYPDAFAQRCEHMADAARLMSEQENDAPTQATLQRLISAQIQHIGEELNSVQSDALDTLSRISNQSSTTTRDFEKYLDEDDSLARIAEEQQQINATSETLQHINEVADHALSNLVSCVEMFNGIEEIFRDLNKMRESVRMSSLNADLSERRAEINLPELRSVTKAVGDCSTSCGAAIDQLGARYDALRTIFARIDQKQISAAIVDVDTRLGQSRLALDGLGEQVHSIRKYATESLETLKAIKEHGMSAHAQIESNQTVPKHLEQIQTRLNGSGESAEHDPTVLKQVFDSYTIETERDVHRSILPESADTYAAQQDDDTTADEEDPFEDFML